MSTIDAVEVRLVRTFNAAPERVFDAWLTPRTLGMWMFGQRPGETVLGLEVDARVGGRFSLRVDRGDGPINHVGRYVILERPRLLEFTWGIEGESDDDEVASVVRLSFAPAGEGCELTLTHRMDARWAAYRDRTEQGWGRMLSTLATLFDQAQAPAEGEVRAKRTATDTLRMERLLPAAPERVWTFLVDPTHRARWLAGGTAITGQGSDFKLDFQFKQLCPDGSPAPEVYRELGERGHLQACTTTVFEPPHRLGFDWGDGSHVLFELMPRGDSTQLTIVHRRLADLTAMANVAGGWHAHGDFLLAALAGTAAPDFWPQFQARETDYRRMLEAG